MARGYTRGVIVTALIATAAVALYAQNTIDISAGGADVIWQGPQAGQHAGYSLDQGDVGAGDGRKDVIIGAPGNGSVGGAVYIVMGGGLPRSGLLSLADADASFTAAPGTSFGAATAAGNVRTAEGSGSRDLIVGAPDAAAGRGAVYVFTGGIAGGTHGTTSNAAAVITGAVGDHLGSALATADLDGDGYREIIAAALGSNRVYVIKGGPSLATVDLASQAAYIVLTGVATSSLYAGDVTGDGVYDAIVGSASANAVYVLRGRMGGGFPATMSISSADIIFNGANAGDGAGTSVRVLDLDADRFSDVVIGAPGGDGQFENLPNSGEVYVLWGGPSLSSRSLADADVTFYGGVSGIAAGSVVAGGNVNRDIANDLVVVEPGAASGAGSLVVYYGRARSEIGQTLPSGRQVVDLTAADVRSRRINGDSTMGVIRSALTYEVTGEGAREILIGLPDAQSGAGRAYVTISPRLLVNRSSFDVVVTEGHTFSARLEASNPSAISITWKATSNQPWLTASPANGSAVATSPGVFTLNVASTLPPGTYTGTITVSSTSPDLEMALPISITVRVAAAAFRSFGDFNGDGSFDLVWWHDVEGWIGSWQMNGPQRVGASLFNPSTAPAGWQIEAVGDFNGDGNPDLIWRNQTNGNIACWFMNGTELIDGAMLSPSHAASMDWKIVGSADFNKDGHRDLLWRNKITGQLAVWLMRGTVLIDGLFITPTMADLNYEVAGLGDINLDGQVDIIWQHRTQGWLAGWLLNGVQLKDGVWLNPNRMADTNWKIVAVGDMNGDGSVDLVWQNQADGRLAAWYMRGPGLIDGVLLNPSQMTDLHWKIVGPR